MQTAAWLASPYLSTLVICRTPWIGRRVAGHTALTLPVGWAAVLALLAALVDLWSPPLAVMLLCAALSGLAMIVAGPGRDDDGPGPEDDGPPPPPTVDWDAFDGARRSWERDRRQGPTRSPSGVA